MTQRLNLNLADESYAELRRLAERTNQSLSRTVRAALTHYGDLISVAERGHRLVEYSDVRTTLGEFPIEPQLDKVEETVLFPQRHDFR